MDELGAGNGGGASDKRLAGIVNPVLVPLHGGLLNGRGAGAVEGVLGCEAAATIDDGEEAKVGRTREKRKREEQETRDASRRRCDDLGGG